jgi:hypothetical protein
MWGGLSHIGGDCHALGDGSVAVTECLITMGGPLDLRIDSTTSQLAVPGRGRGHTQVGGAVYHDIAHQRT